MHNMATAESQKIKHLVVDSGGFICGSPLHDMSEKIYTVQDVISEIRDKDTRERLQCLPYELRIIEPFEEDIAFVKKFAATTGDLASLSTADIKVLALTCYLQGLHVNKNYLTKVPTKGKVLPALANKVVTPREFNVKVDRNENKEDARESSVKVDENENKEDARESSVKVDKNEKKEDDDGTWITPENIHEVVEKMRALGVKSTSKKVPIVACVTVDFAMQNVLLQLGLSLVSACEGRVIKRTSQFVLRCHACAHVTSVMTKKFCPGCGNKDTLKRVSFSVSANGERKIYINPKKRINTRGTKHSLPLPRGGKHANNPILREDQPIPHQRPPKFAIQEKQLASRILHDPDYILRTSPFALNDVTSRAARLKVRADRR